MILNCVACAVDSKKLEDGFRVVSDGCPSFVCFGIRGRSYSNFLASTVVVSDCTQYVLSARLPGKKSGFNKAIPGTVEGAVWWNLLCVPSHAAQNCFKP